MQPLTVTMIQHHTHWHDPAANHEMFAGLLAEVSQSADLVMLPEMFSTGFTMASREVAQSMHGETLGWLQDQSASLNKTLCGSVVIEEAGHFFNRFLWVQPDGSVGTYDKRHRFRMAGEHEHYAAGGAKQVFELNGWRICPMVCYDLRFPVWFRNDNAYDVLICVANWPAARQSAWNTLLRARAIENQSYTLGVNIVGRDGNNIEYRGGSAAYAPDGAILAEHFDTPRLMTVSLDGQVLQDLRKRFPVWQDADRFQLQDGVL